MRIGTHLRSTVGLVAAAALAGCGPSDEEVCGDLVDAVTEALVRCNLGTREQIRQLLEQQLGSCSDVKDIRDEDALYDECIPWLESVECNELVSASQNGQLHESCEDQLLL